MSGDNTAMPGTGTQVLALSDFPYSLR